MVSSFRKLRGYASGGPALSKKQFRAVTKIINKDIGYKQRYEYYNQTSTNLGTMTEFTNLTVGQDITQRGENMIQVKKLKGYVSVEGADSSNIVRVCIVRSKKGALTLADFPALNQEHDPDHYQVLWEKTFMCAGNGPYAYSNVPFKIKLSKGKIPGVNVKYDSTTTTSTANGLYIYHVSDSVASADPDIIINNHMTWQDKP